MGKDFNIDLMELFAGTSKPTSMARRFGLTALQPFEIEDGYDLASKAIQKTVDFALNKFKPLLLMTLVRLITDYNLYIIKCDGGYFGAVDNKGNMTIKTYKLITNSQAIAEALGHQLSSEERAQCTPLEGANVTRSQEYPTEMVEALLKALQKEARRWSAHRFEPTPKEVFFAQPTDDEPTWRRLLEEVDQVFRRGSARSLTLQPGHDLYDRISALIPWEIGRIQIASKPVTRRQPGELPHTHRGNILLHNDDTISIEVEDMVVNQFPKQRFDKPVRAAIFFYGFAAADQPEEQQQQQRDPPVHLPVPGLSTDITFVGAPPTLPASVRASLARLHIGAGHPNKQETIRLLSMHGSINASVLTALEHMKCGSCERNARPTPPKAAAVPHFNGQFSERIQADIFYTRDLSGGNHPILGAVDIATNFQQAIRLVSLNAQHVWDSFRTMWFQPYGYPLMLELDAGTPFSGVFKEHSIAAGIHVVVVPPEAHWRIGAVERRNSVLRTVVEKLVDNHGIVSGEGIDFVLVAATQAINSATATKGRCPYQAVFGKLPRFPGDLLGDEHALTVSDRYMMAEQLRVQALHAINEMRASQTIRRAILRKTPPNKAEAQQILPGALAAYWRWSKKASGKKRGGYALGRLVQHDATSNTAWLQTGGSLVQVTYEQLRPAFGLEGWVPSHEDIRCLKDARQRLQDGLWIDERGQGPPDDEALNLQWHHKHLAALLI
ncbi:Putative RNA pseudouridine synthase [Durusdinium trenchii]|uniref:RNA pseudouridine synthase n=1 Tax=Durusdinium trenchii TaxID=1381693 RepID=A0ABP0I7M1_9DINO